MHSPIMVLTLADTLPPRFICYLEAPVHAHPTEAVLLIGSYSDTWPSMAPGARAIEGPASIPSMAHGVDKQTVNCDAGRHNAKTCRGK